MVLLPFGVVLLNLLEECIFASEQQFLHARVCFTRLLSTTARASLTKRLVLLFYIHLYSKS